LNQFFSWRLLMVLIALAIVSYSVYFTNQLAQKIAIEETKRIKTYASAIEYISKVESNDFSFQMEIIDSNKTIPVILVDNKNNIIDHRNVLQNGAEAANFSSTDSAELKKSLAAYKKMHTPIIIALQEPQYIYYGESYVLKKLKYFPFILFGVIAVFLSIVFIAFNSANKSMQNRVWVGMSKETAHQLGTPLMSLIGWLEYLKMNGQASIAAEMERDVDRLQLIAERFSKIGSTPQLEETDILLRLKNVVEYMRRRSPQKVVITLNDHCEKEIPIMLNGPLFDWVIENLIRNSLDAMQGKGTINIDIINRPAEVVIDLTDSGKGIANSQFKKVFKPGFTTKKRGWGLGLSLAKRIVTKYHHGHIMVLKSEANVATTFRIILDR
jgi:Flp pilus assembly pilin Flp